MHCFYTRTPSSDQNMRRTAKIETALTNDINRSGKQMFALNSFRQTIRSQRSTDVLFSDQSYVLRNANKSFTRFAASTKPPGGYLRSVHQISCCYQYMLNSAIFFYISAGQRMICKITVVNKLLKQITCIF